MPLYEYECAACGTFEELQKVSDPPLKKCPQCGKRVKKLISSPALHFKGEGFWVTDYGWKSKQAQKGKGGGSDAKGSDSGKAEKKEAGSAKGKPAKKE